VCTSGRSPFSVPSEPTQAARGMNDNKQQVAMALRAL